MIAFVIYLFIFLVLISKNNFFGVFKDDKLKSNTFTLLFFLKAGAIIAFYFVYKKLYGGVEKFDAGKFYSDATIINDFALKHPLNYLKLLFGFQDETPGTDLYENYIKHTTQWENGRIREFFYNDNRVIIRIHSLLHFIAFKSYFVHALFSCFFSFVGVTFIYKALNDFFKGKEFYVLLILCFLPALWFYTGGLLKEGLVIFILGNLLYTLKKLFSGNGSLRTLLWFCVLVFFSCLLKPYLLLFAAFLFGFFFWLYNSKKIIYKTTVFFLAIGLSFLLLNFFFKTFKKNSLIDAAVRHQRIFADASKGGIFLLDDVKFVRLEFDSKLVKKINDSVFNIKKNVPYIYWEHSHQQDTLLSSANSDTVTKYKLVYQLPKSGSNIDVNFTNKNIIEVCAYSFYYCLLYPLFFNSKSLLQQVASFENVILIVSFIIFLIGVFQNKKDKFPAIAFVTFAVLLCLLIGITTPNSGAIFRYRSPAVIFVLLAALYYLPVSKNKRQPISN